VGSERAYLRRAVLGIVAKTASLPVQVQKIFKLPFPTVVEIVSIQKGSPADDAKLEKGDQILSINNKSVAGVDDINREIGQKKAGTEFALSLLRNNRLKEITVTSKKY
jgi:S1-C subfamily serine protease